MRSLPCLLSSLLLLTACKRQARVGLAPDLALSNNLAGTWTFQLKYPDGINAKFITTWAPDGSAVTTISLPSRKNGPRIVRLEGTWRVENGLLIDVVTNDSQINASVPRASRFRITHLDQNELDLAEENSPAGTFNRTSKIIYLRQAE